MGIVLLSATQWAKLCAAPLLHTYSRGVSNLPVSMFGEPYSSLMNQIPSFPLKALKTSEASASNTSCAQPVFCHPTISA